MSVYVYEIGDRVRLNAYHGRDDFAATGVVENERTRPDGSPDYVVRLDVPVTSGDLSLSLISRAGDALRLEDDCVVCGAPARFETRDENASGPWIAVCSDEHGDVALAHADDCDCDVCAEEDGALVTDDDVRARVLADDADANVIDTKSDGVQQASIIGGTDDDPRVFVTTWNTHGQSLVFAFATLDRARTYYDAVTVDFDTEGL